MGEHREFVASFERMGEGVWSVDDQIADPANEVVRCRDCRHFIEDSESCMFFHSLPFGDEVEVMVHQNGFCAWGERK